MYLSLLVFSFCLLYLILLPLFAWFFGAPRPVFTRTTLWALGVVALACLVIFSFTFSLNDPIWRNRVQHGLGCGFLTFGICFLAAKFSEIKLSRARFALFSFLLVTALGVLNEVIEFVLQNYFDFFFTAKVNDTWLDLISNWIGILVAGLIFVPLWRDKRGV